MAENLNLAVGDACWYERKAENGKKYGRLYTWEEAMQAGDLVAGWHLPTDEEWKTLEKHLGMSAADADKLGWSDERESW